MPRDLSRRGFLSTTGGLLAGAGLSPGLRPRLVRGESRPPVRNPRATSGDTVHEPDWAERLTLTVGPDKADLVGRSDKVIQAAVDYVARLGGGTVKVLPGTYVFRNSVFLANGVRLLGSGADSILTKNDSHSSALADDSDWYDQEVTLANAGEFQVGDGVCLQTTNPSTGATDVLKRTLVARSGNRFKLDKPLRKNFWLSGTPTASALFPLLTSEYTADCVIENVTLDGNRQNNENLNGNYGGCIFLQDCNRYTIRGVTTRNYNGDGISWQICHDVVIENCHSHDNADLGLHPGSGSQRPVMRNNTLERNGIGIFFCWGVKFGLAEGNSIRDNRNYGVSIGHNDTDNLICRNEITGSGQVGVLFRDDSRGKDFWPNRNRLVQNRIIDSGAEEGIGVDVRGKTREVTIADNALRETRAPMQRTGIRIGKDARQIELEQNVVDGFAVRVSDERSP